MPASHAIGYFITKPEEFNGLRRTRDVPKGALHPYSGMFLAKPRSHSFFCHASPPKSNEKKKKGKSAFDVKRPKHVAYLSSVPRFLKRLEVLVF